MKKLGLLLAGLAIGAMVAVGHYAFEPAPVEAGGEVYAHHIVDNTVDSTDMLNDGIGSEDIPASIHLTTPVLEVPNVLGDSATVNSRKLLVYSDSVVFGDTAQIVVEDWVIGDSLAVTATATKIYGTLTASGTATLSGTVNATGDVNASGDSVAVTATALKVYGSLYLAAAGVDSLTEKGDSLLIANADILADSTACCIFWAELGDPVGNLYRRDQWAGGCTIVSDGDETSPLWIYWFVFKTTD